MKTIIMIPARYGSSRLPGKPLLMLAGKTMLQRVCEIAQLAAANDPSVSVLVLTDDQRIMQHATDIGVSAMMTASDCPSGTDRIIAAVKQLKIKPNAVINLQGDAPLTPVSIIQDLLQLLKNSSTQTIITPVIQLSWSELASLRQTKISSPFSGTTVILNSKNEAIWFSKNIIPAIRDEKSLIDASNLSPIYQHLGIYAYTVDILENFNKLPIGYYEKLEGLEQLRFLENNFKIKTIKANLRSTHWRGVDTLEDAQLITAILKTAD